MYKRNKRVAQRVYKTAEEELAELNKIVIIEEVKAPIVKSKVYLKETKSPIKEVIADEKPVKKVKAKK